MERIANQLDATGLSRLAWLFMLEGNEIKGNEYARKGFEKDPTNEYCRKFLGRISKAEIR
jgi:hypothetical protein